MVKNSHIKNRSMKKTGNEVNVSNELLKPELVCPAGDWPSLVTAVESGADSIYFGVKDMNMRARAKNFDVLEIPKIMDFLRKKNKKGYLALNVIVMNDELGKVERILRTAKDAGIDAVILWDMGILSLAEELGLSIHLSTQASVANAKALSFFADRGVRRVVLARECTLAQIKQVIDAGKKQNIPCRVETFIHGAMCLSVSGRCFLSSYSFGESANRGACMQPCRREYYIRDTNGEADYIIGNDYLLSPKDLCTITFIDKLIEAGIHAFKIEGRIRSVEYIKLTVSTYRKAVDAYFEGKLDATMKKNSEEILARVYNRGFSSGFYFGQPENWTNKGFQKSFEKIYIGEVIKFFKRINVAEIVIHSGKLKKGDQLFISGKKTPAGFCTAEELQIEHRYITEVEKGSSVGIKLPFPVRRKDKVFLWKPIE
jgi:putative protease